MVIIGSGFYFLAFIAPLFTFPFVWKVSKANKYGKVLLSILFSVLLSALFFAIGITFLFSEGMGPT